MRMYCEHCKEEHVVSPTYDGAGNVVGQFCNRAKLLATAYTTEWNGENIRPHIMAFMRENLDIKAMKRMKPERLIFLAKRLAYRLLQTEWAQKRRLNFAFVTYWMHKEIERQYGKHAAKAGG